MQNLCFSPPKVFEKPFVSSFKDYVQKTDVDGATVLVEIEDRYAGLSADSFSLQAQLDAGVPLDHLSPISPGSLSAIDKNNVNGEQFVNNLKSNSKK